VMGGGGLDRGHGVKAFAGDRPGRPDLGMHWLNLGCTGPAWPCGATTVAPSLALGAMAGGAAMLVVGAPIVAY
jgi:hypothetical protein